MNIVYIFEKKWNVYNPRAHIDRITDIEMKWTHISSRGCVIFIFHHIFNFFLKQTNFLRVEWFFNYYYFIILVFDLILNSKNDIDTVPFDEIINKSGVAISISTLSIFSLHFFFILSRIIRRILKFDWTPPLER